MELNNQGNTYQSTENELLGHHENHAQQEIITEAIEISMALIKELQNVSLP